MAVRLRYTPYGTGLEELIETALAEVLYAVDEEGVDALDEFVTVALDGSLTLHVPVSVGGCKMDVELELRGDGRTFDDMVVVVAGTAFEVSPSGRVKSYAEEVYSLYFG